MDVEVYDEDSEEDEADLETRQDLRKSKDGKKTKATAKKTQKVTFKTQSSSPKKGKKKAKKGVIRNLNNEQTKPKKRYLQPNGVRYRKKIQEIISLKKINFVGIIHPCIIHTELRQRFV